MDLAPYEEFAKEKLGIKFNNINLLVTALTHRSYVNEHRKTVHEHNERLEYLGDAVLELVSSDFLYRKYHIPEGVMTAVRAALVRTESIGEAGKELGYEPLVRMSRGELKGTERAHDSILADCFEAVLGAVYLDQGYEAARRIVNEHILSKADKVIEEGSWRDPKSYVQELAQKYDGATPTYRTLKEEGPDHDKKFTVGIYVNEKLKGTGTGHSKQEAQTEAAKEGVKKYTTEYLK
ncbi:ribonuclease III [Candidatus Saccharibacteria bacterium]|nr:ribonuclease III [Candidatus Saccharibacteria bacterium]MBR3121949.1 ribonuclease III [Candidatus Saccharibacteria bacterium]